MAALPPLSVETNVEIEVTAGDDKIKVAAINSKETLRIKLGRKQITVYSRTEYLDDLIRALRRLKKEINR